MKIVVNGKDYITKDGISLLDLLKEKNINIATIAIAINEEIIDKENLESIVLKENDILELLIFAGGG